MEYSGRRNVYGQANFRTHDATKGLNFLLGSLYLATVLSALGRYSEALQISPKSYSLNKEKLG